ncbi:MAG: hypothetical protein ACRDDD_12000 [Plesiomonas sp.]|uniref:hypothetical protein n=1 Tax=Plesiomonas sp. TaxID=2486279 RepID=UPI003EE671A1
MVKSFYLMCFVLMLLPEVEAASRLEGDNVLSVALSDNLVVLDDSQRSSFIELVNLGRTPTEFALQSIKFTGAATAKDGAEFIRWAPERARVPANRTLPMRISARNLEQLSPGEYVLQVNVSAQRRPNPVRSTEAQNKEASSAVAVSIPVVPVLPITIYLRHQIDTPMITAQPLVYTPKDPDFLGYFPVTKKMAGVSFVGLVQLVDKATDEVVSSGRLHLQPSSKETKVRMPRGKFTAKAKGNYCLRIWDHFPAQGAPAQEQCSS